MTEVRYIIILRTYHTRTSQRGTKWEKSQTIHRDNKTNQVLMLDPVKLDRLLRKGTPFRMACLGFKLVKIIGITTFDCKKPGEQHELTVTEVKEN